MINDLCYDLIEKDTKLLEERRELTLIIAVKESDDSLLIGADSLNSEDGGLKSQRVTKLFRHNSRNIVWGTTGNRDLGKYELTPWLQSLTITGNWDWLKTTVADKIAELNGRQRAREAIAGISPNPSSVICCLMVGWLKEPQIYEFTSDARVDSYIDDSFRAIGSGFAVAYGAYNAMSRVQGEEITNQRRFEIILDSTCSCVSSCGGPYHIIRVKKDGIEDVK